jgi:precorrin-6Y C5,15-methyltransferase (decarboxylating)
LAPAGTPSHRLAGDLDPAVEALAAVDGPACVLASGDPGFFGIVRVLAERLGRERLDIRPAPSSIAVAFARLGFSWDDAIVVSAHARGPGAALHSAMRHRKVAILTDRTAPPSWYAQRLADTGTEMAVAERLGERDERVVTGAPRDFVDFEAAEPNVVVVWDPSVEGNGRARVWPPRPAPDGWALDETAFEHRAGMITKPEVRALVLARLGPGIGDLVWDVGCGSGSVAIECARLGAAAVGLDHDADAIALALRNAAAHGVPVRAVRGSAPEALAELPDPDAVFVGGGGANLLTILDVCAERAPQALVTTLALVERAGPVVDRLAAAGFEVEATMVQASRLKPMPGGHRLAAENPVIVVAGRRSATTNGGQP